ncbi:MAG: TIGR03663 family protein [Chloroflexi bacterium]|nr:TIGR03663 family protein [Chloroflexota bacterium]
MLTGSAEPGTLEAPPSSVAVPQPTRPVDRPRRRLSWYVVAYVLLLAVTLGMRLWGLGSMALHHDESLHATYSWYIYMDRGYQHMPMMHGPFKFFGAAALFHLLGDSVSTARLLPALMGTLLVALPLLLRSYLGRTGALATSVLLAFSPSMLYYSRFLRDDIFMMVWSLLLIAFLWRYLEARKTRYLALSAAVLAMAFATEETAYLLAFVVGSYLFLWAIGDVALWLLGLKPLKAFSAPGDFLVLMGTLLLPLGAAAVALFQGKLGIILANPDWQAAPSGIPLGSGLYVAFFVGMALLAASVVIGLCWRPKVWVLCASVFWGIWVLLFTSFFTNLWGGLGSGMWQALGYWIVQQDVARGGQPWYYYFVIGMNYEFLPFLVGGVAVVVYTIRGDNFGRFLVYWAIVTFLALIYASEKMPWILVDVTFPLTVLAGRLIGSLLDRHPWHGGGQMSLEATALGRARVHWPAVGFSVALALLVVAEGWWLLLALSRQRNLVYLLAVGVVSLALVVALVYLFGKVGAGKRLALVGVTLAVAMFGLTIPSSLRVAYVNADVPVEMLVYTQSAPDIPQIMAQIDRVAKETGKGQDLKVMVDSADGYSWPWAWYLRDYRNVNLITCFTSDPGCIKLSSKPDADVVLLNERSQRDAAPYMDAYGEPVRYKHRWWFPESYRGLTPKGILKGVISREPLCKVAAYFVFREFGQLVGSVDAYAYFPKGFDPGPIGQPLPGKRMQC